jgi:hypothetical protein
VQAELGSCPIPQVRKRLILTLLRGRLDRVAEMELGATNLVKLMSPYWKAVLDHEEDWANGTLPS